jgi:hypothetical protein
MLAGAAWRHDHSRDSSFSFDVRVHKGKVLVPQETDEPLF